MSVTRANVLEDALHRLEKQLFFFFSVPVMLFKDFFNQLITVTQYCTRRVCSKPVGKGVYYSL